MNKLTILKDYYGPGRHALLYEDEDSESVNTITVISELTAYQLELAGVRINLNPPMILV